MSDGKNEYKLSYRKAENKFNTPSQDKNEDESPEVISRNFTIESKNNYDAEDKNEDEIWPNKEAIEKQLQEIQEEEFYSGLRSVNEEEEVVLAKEALAINSVSKSGARIST